MPTIRRGLAVLALAGASLALSTGPAHATAAWEPPPGYTLENSYFGGSVSGWCDRVGTEGAQKGQWTAYVCHDVMRRLADLYYIYGDLYVKR
ncbi:hypothetical protein [Nonomuraea insulae]|uniref:Secreted protein n=1 Tax=Nonomuraea insulae TaxID=1616787 RepID=A0ABW1CGB4_9ACTN